MKTTTQKGLIAETSETVALLEAIRQEHATVNENLRMVLAMYREINAAADGATKPAKVS